jgi:trigger factor
MDTITSSLKVQVHDLGPVRKRLEVEVPADEVRKEIDELTKAWAKSVRLPGFRKGHVPVAVIRQKFQREVEEEAKERMVDRFLHEAIEQKGFEPVHEPVIEDVTLSPGEPLRFKSLFEIRPPIELGDYKGLAEVAAVPETTDEDVEKTLQTLRTQSGRLVPAEGRPAAAGDFAVCDVDGKFPAGGGEDFRHDSVLLEIGGEHTLPEFTAALTGAAPGDVRTCEVNYPQEFEAKNLAGRTVGYTLTVKELKTRLLPDLDDEFAREIGEPAGLETLKTRIRKDLGDAAARRARRDAREAALGKLIEAHPVAVPEVLVEDELRRQLEDLLGSLARQGVDLEKANINFQELRDKQRPLAEKRARGMLLLDAIVRKEALRVNPAEVQSRIAAEARAAGVQPDVLKGRLDKSGGTQALALQILRERALDILIDRSSITA